MCFLVRAGGQTVLVDTGAGPKGLWTDWMPEPESQEKLLPELRRHGVDPDDVQFIRRHAVFPNARAREVLGWEPKIDLPEGMQRTETWLREEGMLS